MKKKILIYFTVFLLCLTFTGCSNSEGKVSDDTKNNDNTEEKKEKVNYTTGITDIMDAMKYELGLYFYDEVVTDYGMNSENRVITASTKELKARDLKDKMLTEYIYQYLEKDNSSDIFTKTYTEDEIKKVLSDLYGENYIYNHKLTEQTACSSMVYKEDKNGYVVEGGCGGINVPSEPHILMKVLETKEKDVILGRVYVVPSVASDGYDEEPPYQIYSDETKSNQIGTVNSKGEIFTSLKDKVDKYQIHFDKENGFYHFNYLRKIK